MSEELTKAIKELTLSLGADKVGIADATLAEDAPHGHAHPNNILKGAKAAISIVLAYPDAAIDCDHTDDLIHAGVFVAVQHNMNAELTRIALGIAKFLEKKGYNATPIAPDVPGRDEKRWAGTISHRYIGQLAGVGEIGQSNLLLTPEWGPRIQLATVLTDAPLIEDGPQLIDKVCKKCYECCEKCPPRALARENYPPYNFNLNRCFWGVDGWARLTKVEEPPKDWVDARPTALIMVSKYAQKYPQIQEYQDLATRMGFFPFCNECQRVCKVGLNAKSKKVEQRES
jgi:epoxyqueuosine reductase